MEYLLHDGAVVLVVSALVIGFGCLIRRMLTADE